MSGPGNNPPKQSGSGFWPGLEANRTEPPVKTPTGGGLPGPVADTKSGMFGQGSIMLASVSKKNPTPYMQLQQFLNAFISI